MKIAARLGVCLQECKQGHTVSEFWEWKVFLDQEEEEKLNAETQPSKQDWYMARIAMEIDRSHGRKGQVFELKKYLLPFTREKKTQQVEEPLTEQQVEEKKQQASAWAKAKWFGWLGMKG